MLSIRKGLARKARQQKNTTKVWERILLWRASLSSVNKRHVLLMYGLRVDCPRDKGFPSKYSVLSYIIVYAILSCWSRQLAFQYIYYSSTIIRAI